MLNHVIDEIFEAYGVDVVLECETESFFYLESEGGKMFRVCKKNLSWNEMECQTIKHIN